MSYMNYTTSCKMPYISYNLHNFLFIIPNLHSVGAKRLHWAIFLASHTYISLFFEESSILRIFFILSYLFFGSFIMNEIRFIQSCKFPLKKTHSSS